MNLTKLLVKNILEKAEHYHWSLQGLGMLRLYLSQEVRLHVWHSKFKFPGASPIHTHPWDFKSTIVAGALTNIRYIRDVMGKSYRYSVLKCGVSGHLKDRGTGTEANQRLMGDGVTQLIPCRPENYVEGDSYVEMGEEIHESCPADGTVTLVERTFKEDRDHAMVFWPDGEEWGTAEPRDATKLEVEWITRYALAQHFKA